VAIFKGRHTIGLAAIGGVRWCRNKSLRSSVNSKFSTDCQGGSHAVFMNSVSKITATEKRLLGGMTVGSVRYSRRNDLKNPIIPMAGGVIVGTLFFLFLIHKN